jgi:OFA family oxalate/formate antiporter-like MFS transporter
MVLIANLQYGWTLFVPPLQAARGWSIPNIQIAFTIFVALETWGTPINGWFADRLGAIGPRVVMGCGGVLVALGWIINSFADNLIALYIGQVVCGFGAGGVYCTAVGTAVKWFKDRRGLAVGLVAGGFGAGAALTIIPIQMVVEAHGYTSAFFWFGLIQGGLVLLIAQFIRNPAEHGVPVVVEAKVKQSKRSYTPREMVGHPIFWLLYLLETIMASGGLMVTANFAPLARAFGVATLPTFLGATTLAVALILASVLNGVGRPLFGWLGDHIGRSREVTISFTLGAVAYFSLSQAGTTSTGFIVFGGLIFLCWGEIFGFFPAMCTDLFGPKYATANASVLYTSKGVAALLVPLANVAVTLTGSWTSLLYLTTAINVVAVVLVIMVLRPAEIRHHSADALQAAPVVPTPPGEGAQQGERHEAKVLTEH